MADAALKTFKNKLYAEFEDLQGQLQTIFDKAQQEGQTNPMVVFADFIGFSQTVLGRYLEGNGKQPASSTSPLSLLTPDSVTPPVDTDQTSKIVEELKEEYFKISVKLQK